MKKERALTAPYETLFELKGVQLAVSSETLSIRPEDLSVAGQIAAARGESRAVVIGWAIRRLLSVLALLEEGEPDPPVVKRLREFHEGLNLEKKLPRARAAMSNAERRLMDVVCENYQVWIVAFCGFSIRNYAKALDLVIDDTIDNIVEDEKDSF